MDRAEDAGEPPGIDLAELSTFVDRPDEHARTAVRARLSPTGGALGDLAGWLAGTQGVSPPRAPRRVRLVLAAADHGLGDASVDVPGARSTEQRLREVAEGGGVAATAALVGVSVRLLSLPAAHRPDEAASMSRPDAEAAFTAGLTVVDQEVDAGTDLLVLGALGAGAGTAASVLTGLLTRNDAAAVTGRGQGIDDATWMRRCAVVRDAMRRCRPAMGDPLGVLAGAGGGDLTLLTAVLVQAAIRRTPVLLDGAATTAAALMAQRIAFRAADWWQAGHRSPEPAHGLALDRLGLSGLLDLRLRRGDGTGALLAVPLVQAAAAEALA